MEDLAKIKDRIAKLLRMAADSASPNEAAIAAGRARALMDKHQLDELDINTEIKQAFGEQRVGRAFAAMPEYLDWFATAVAQYNDCQHILYRTKVDFKKKGLDYFEKKTGRQSAFRGYETDVALAKQMFDALTEAVDKLCKEYVRSLGYKKYPVGIGGQFKHGAFSVISDRLRQMTKERDAITYAGGTSLVLVKSTAVSAHFGDIKYKEGKGRDIDDHSEAHARRAGHIAGKTVEIVKTLDESVEESDRSALRLN